MNRLGCLLLLGFVLIAGAFWRLSRPAALPGGPVPATTVPAAPPPASAATPSATLVAAGGLRIPVAGVRPDQLVDSFSDGRGGDTRVHGAIDIMAPRGTPVIAAAPGTVEKLFDSKAGGHTIYVRSPDTATVFYYAHLDAYAIGLTEGAKVTPGQQIATVGSTGDADPAAPHLHFEVKRMAPGEPWYKGTAVDPYPLLGGTVAGGAVAR